LDHPADPRQILAYLDHLGQWVSERRHQLDRLDRAILARPDAAAQTGDLMVALSVWQSIQHRYDALLRTWDSGRVGPVQQRQLSQLMWGRLDEDPHDAAPPGPLDLPAGALSPAGVGAGQPPAPSPGAPTERPEVRPPAVRPAGAATGPGMAVNLPEACRLLDALTGQLSAQLRLTPNSTQSALRLNGLRAQAERLRDQIQLEPHGRLDALRRSVDDIAADIAHLSEKADRGGDIGGLLGPLEIRAAHLERDLIVGNAQRRQNQAKATRVARRRAELEARAQRIAGLAADVRQRVQPAPKYAVPQVAALGPIPDTETGLDTYADRLSQVERALDVVEQANHTALAGLERLRAELSTLRVQAAERNASDPAFTALADQAAALLDRTPTPVEVVRPILAAYRAALSAHPGAAA
jgi:hypothetical protein